MMRRAWMAGLLGVAGVLGFAGVVAKGIPPRLVLVAAEQGVRDLAVINLGKGVVEGAVPVGGVTGHEVATDGPMAFVPVYGDSGVGKPGTDGRMLVKIDVPGRRVVQTLDFGHGVRPHCPVLSHGLLYVTTELDRSITLIDPKTLRLAGSVPTGADESHMLAITQDGRHGYTANVGVATGKGSVSVLDLEARKLVTVIPISKQTQRIALSRDDRWVFTADQTRPELVVIDTRTNRVARRVTLPELGYGTAATPDGRWLLVCIHGSDTLAVVDLQSWAVVKTVKVGAHPTEVVIDPGGRRAYVSSADDKSVTAVDLQEWKPVERIAAGAGVDGMAFATE